MVVVVGKAYTRALAGAIQFMHLKGMICVDIHTKQSMKGSMIGLRLKRPIEARRAGKELHKVPIRFYNITVSTS